MLALSHVRGSLTASVAGFMRVASLWSSWEIKTHNSEITSSVIELLYASPYLHPSGGTFFSLVFHLPHALRVNSKVSSIRHNCHALYLRYSLGSSYRVALDVILSQLVLLPPRAAFWVEYVTRLTLSELVLLLAEIKR